MKKYFLSMLLPIAGALSAQGACPPATLNVKVQLQGAYNASANQMNTALKAVTTFPLSEPYSSLGFPTRSSTGTETTTAAILGASPVVDWILIELRNKTNPNEVFFTAAGLLLADGTVVNPSTGTGGLVIGVPEDDYYLAIAHRNHLRIRTASTQHIAPSAPLALDFTNGSVALQETSPGTAQVTLPGGSLGLQAGDANHNGNVRYNGPANDRDALLSYLGGNEIGFVSDVYATEDMNMNGNVRYNGPGNDRDFLLSVLGGDEVGFVAAQTTAGTLSSVAPACSETPTPVTWASFHATVSGTEVQLTWETRSERNSAFFEIQHAVDGRTFETIGRVNAKGTTQQKNVYSFSDKPASAGTLHYYRLKQVDTDGTFSFSKVMSVQMEGYVGIRLSLASHPSFRGEIEVLVEYGDPNLTSATTVELLDLQGRVISRQQLQLNTGINRARFGTMNLTPGTYLVSVRNNSLARPLSQRVIRP